MDDPLEAVFRQTLQRFVQSEVEPRAGEFDMDPAHPGLAGLISKARDLGLLSLRDPPEKGGGGLGLPGTAAALREVARGCAGVAAVLLVHHAATGPLIQTLRPRRVEGLAAPVLPGIAEASPDGSLRGTARFVLGGLRADSLLVFARGPDGVSGCYWVPTADTRIRRRPLHQAGLRACPAAEVVFEGARGERVAGDAAPIWQAPLASLRIGAAAVALGVADSARAVAAKYASERSQGGVPIIDHQQVRLLLGQMTVETRAAGALLGEACENPAGDAPLAAKIAASEAAMRASTDAVQILGGYGYMRDYGLEKRMRDAALLLAWPEVNQEALLGVAPPPER